MGERAVLSKWARTHEVPLLEAASGRDTDVAAYLKQLAPEVICVSAFPWLLGNGILGTARQAALNIHSSLLPRHRGPNPLLWTYYHNDCQSGVTVHRMNERADAGDILEQVAFGLPRGFPIDRVYARHATCGAELLVRALGKLETGDLAPIAQDDRFSTYAPQVPHGVAMVNFADWDVERVWHFLAGLCPRRREPLRDQQQNEVRYKSVLGYQAGDCAYPAGVVCRASHGWNLFCRNGSIQLGDGAGSRFGA
jgi:methionyl-tRNA formyltransferase